MEQIDVHLCNYLSDFVTERRLELINTVLNHRTHYVRLVLDGVPDSGDVCAVMRSCECFGVQNLDLIQHKGHLFQAQSGVAVGSRKWINFSTHTVDAKEPSSAASFLKNLQGQGYSFGLLSKEPQATAIQDLALNQKFALILPGHLGPSAEVLATECQPVFLPTVGFSDGFNISVTATLCMYALTAVLHGNGAPWKLDPSDRQELKLRWLAQTPKRISEITDQFLTQHNQTRSRLRESLSPQLMALLYPDSESLST